MINSTLQVFFAPILTLLALVIMVSRNPLLSDRRKRLFYGASILLTLIIASLWVDYSLMRLAPTPAVLMVRRIAIFVHYGLSPVAPMMLALIHRRKSKKEKWWFFLPATIALAVNIVGIFTGCVISVTEQNSSELGTMYFLPYLVGGIYLLLLLNRAMGQNFRPNRQAEGALITSSIIVFAITIVLEVVWDLRFILWTTATAFLLLYFLQLNVEKVSFDSLTGTYSQVAFSNVTKKLRRGNGKDCTIAMVDMNGLKYFNDTFNHEAGNSALKQMSGAILSATEGHHMRVYRHGGDEFVVVALRLCREEMEQLLEAGLGKCGQVNGVGVSFAYGVTEFHAGNDLRAAISEADERMYAHKRATSKMPRREEYEVLEEVSEEI